MRIAIGWISSDETNQCYTKRITWNFWQEERNKEKTKQTFILLQSKCNLSEFRSYLWNYCCRFNCIYIANVNGIEFPVHWTSFSVVKSRWMFFETWKAPDRLFSSLIKKMQKIRVFFFLIKPPKPIKCKLVVGEIIKSIKRPWCITSTWQSCPKSNGDRKIKSESKQ